MAVKADMERCGLFKEMGYHTIGDKYPKTHVSLIPINKQAGVGKQLLVDGLKSKSATQAGYFDKNFVRVFEKEGYFDAIKEKRVQNIAKKKKNLAGEFIPVNSCKKPNGKGMPYGTFAGKIDYLSPITRKNGVHKSLGPNFLNNPSKKGSGYGYENVTIGKSYPYKGDKYDRQKTLDRIERKEFKSKMKAGAFKLNMHPVSYFNENPYRSDKHLPKLKPRRSMSTSRISNKVFLCSSPGKSSAGCHAGTFDPFPKYIHDPYKRKGKAGTKFKGNKPFYPNQHLKSRPYTSILNQNVKKKSSNQLFSMKK